MALSELFWTNMYIFAGGFLLAFAGICYRSKCDNVRFCWGCISIDRNVAIELAEDRLRPPPSTSMQMNRSTSSRSGSVPSARALSDNRSQMTESHVQYDIESQVSKISAPLQLSEQAREPQLPTQNEQLHKFQQDGAAAELWVAANEPSPAQPSHDGIELLNR